MTGEPIHSGKELYGNVDVLGMSAAELCRRIGVPGEPITEILNRPRRHGAAPRPRFRDVRRILVEPSIAL